MASLDERIPCPDEMCTGTINEQGFCNYCGLSRDGRPPAPPEEEALADEMHSEDGERIPCADEMCTGTINERGICNYCGRPYPRQSQ